MKRGQVFVRAKDPFGKWKTVDVLDLTEESFRVFTINMLMRAGLVTYIKGEHIEGEELELRSTH